jgi:hypothetical protein
MFAAADKRARGIFLEFIGRVELGKTNPTLPVFAQILHHSELGGLSGVDRGSSLQVMKQGRAIVLAAILGVGVAVVFGQVASPKVGMAAKLEQALKLYPEAGARARRSRRRLRRGRRGRRCLFARTVT